MFMQFSRACKAGLLTGLLCASTFAALGQQRPSGKILGGYFEEWSIYGANYNIANLQQNGVAGKLTHLMYAFANVGADGTCSIADSWADYQTPYLPSVSGAAYTGPLYGNFAALQQLKQLHPGLKILMSIGGASAANTANFATAASTVAGRQTLASSCINMFIKGNFGPGITAPGIFDGFNVDWEFPGAADTQNFTAMLQEFRVELDALGKASSTHYVMSFDGPAGAQNYVNIDLKHAAQQVDFITVDGYNYAGSWDTQTNHASPLFDDRRDPLYGQNLDIDDTVNAYLRAGVPPQKYTMGLPLYGAGWSGVPNVNHGLYQGSTGPSVSPTGDVLATDGVATYGTLASASGYKRTYDLPRMAVSLYNPTLQTFYTFDDPTTATLKMLYIDLKVPGGLGGAYVWALKDDDASGTMVKTMANVLR